MDDRELLELAARAAGYKHTQWSPMNHPKVAWGVCTIEQGIWNPLADDGDALRLAVKLNLAVGVAQCWTNGDPIRGAMFGEDPLQGKAIATRRAIVRAAAAIAQEMTDAQGDEARGLR